MVAATVISSGTDDARFARDATTQEARRRANAGSTVGTEEQIAFALWQAKGGTSVMEVQWRMDYNESRPHSALGGLTSRPFAAGANRARHAA